jgi:hypothetical protein
MGFGRYLRQPLSPMRLQPYRQIVIKGCLYVVFAVTIVVSGCSSQPSKYRRKKGCDCPKWNMHGLPANKGIHANFGPDGHQHHEHVQGAVRLLEQG